MRSFRLFFLLLLFLLAPVAVPKAAAAGWCGRCEGIDDYKPPRGVLKLWTWPIKTEWEQRHHCLPCGRKVPYTVKVVTYRERYTDGTQRTWKCVLSRTEVALGK